MKQGFDGEVAGRTIIMAGMAVAGIFYGYLEGVNQPTKAILTIVGFLVGVVIGFIWDKGAFTLKPQPKPKKKGDNE